MKPIILLVSIFLMAVIACGPNRQAAPETKAEATKVVVLVTKMPTATNFPRIGTPTPIPPTLVPRPTPTPPPVERLFDDPTLAEMMTGTISSAGIEAHVEIVDSRESGGQRTANVTLVSEYEIDESDLMLKIFVLEVGNALRVLRAFGDGAIDADLDAAHLDVVDEEGQLLGTVTAPISEINAFMDGEMTVDETLAKLELTGVFETFK